jgi:signal transduction histidine kinase/AmiR/NasT family two-component response regulator
MFRSLRTKLTVLYASLFGAILLLISLVTFAAVSDNAMRVVARELTASGAVFGQVLRLRADQLENGAGLLSRDFGFRAAVASNDAATINSALENLRNRLGIDLAVVIGADGRMHGAGARDLSRLRSSTLETIQTGDGAAGVIVLGGQPYELVSVPVTAPTTIGWVVFAARLDRAQLAHLETMASIPLNAAILHSDGDRAWRAGSAGALARSDPLPHFVDEALAGHETTPRAVGGDPGAAMTLARPLPSIETDRPIVLVLRYALARAFAPYFGLFALLFGASVAGFIALLIGARALARSISQPILALEEAAGRLREGEMTEVQVQSADEIGRLAETFNQMVARIGERDAERDRNAETLERARDAAEAANRAKSSFLANMSHEVRTPLNGVIGVAGVLAGSQLKADQRGMVEIIQNSAAVLQRVLNDVLDLAKVEAGQMQILSEAFSLDETIGAIASSQAVLCKAKGLAFRVDNRAPAAPAVLGDRIRLEQVLGNLLSNALKFTAEGQISLTIEAIDGGRRFVVRDTGIGFDPAQAEALFKPFQQADASDTRKYGGTGLGLSISRELARAMGGELTGSAAPGQGATFTLDLPLPVTANAPDACAPTPLGSPTHLDDHGERPLRILLADDHETNRQVVGLILEGLGVELVGVENGAEAVEAFRADRFDLVLMDMQMPVMDGLGAIAVIRAHERDTGAAPTPILVLSANTLPEHVEAAQAVGADGHVAKPITPQVLLTAIEAALDAGEATQSMTA